ncbi:polyamine aminopropyltransferase [Curvivirga sp.]|uniref:polyamine aminopropyltransferase n=1 Tax=Curvivirga sp. TaxID=2856848 RepID=UPI003B5C93DD
MTRWVSESLYEGCHQSFRADKILYEEKTEHQELIIFENDYMGRMMTLDGIVQTTDRDEFMYHEMISHVPIFAHGDAKNVLIIGGGDGGVLREVLRHKNIQCTIVEIDASVIDMSKEFFPNHSKGAFEHPNCNLVIGDGLKFVKETKDRFDVIIVDSTDPIGPGQVLFTADFYQDCSNILSDKGILVTQNGVPFYQADEVTNTYIRMSPYFDYMSFYVVAVPTYVGGFMTLAWASHNPDAHKRDVIDIRKDYEAEGFKTKYYTPEIHVASFALPPYITELMQGRDE